MKNIQKMWMAMIAILMCMGFVACSSGDNDPVLPEGPKPVEPQEPKMVSVNINIEDFVDVEEIPLGSRTTSEYNDLYLIYVKNESTNKCHAYGLFDLSSDITLKLIEGDSYNIEGSAVRDGKTRVRINNEGVYAPPFFAKLTNSFNYNDASDYNYQLLQYFLVEDKDQETIIAKDFELYILDTHPSQSFVATDELSLTLLPSRIMNVGTELKAVDMSEGELHVDFTVTGTDNKTYTSPEVVLTEEDQVVSNSFTFNGLFATYLTGEGLKATMNMTWVKADGSEVILNPVEITFKMNYKYAISIKVDKSTATSVSVNKIPDTTPGYSKTESYFVYNGSITTE